MNANPVTIVTAPEFADRTYVGPITRKLTVPNAERVFFICHALRAGFTIEEIHQLTKIDRWFLAQIQEVVECEEEPAGCSKQCQALA